MISCSASFKCARDSLKFKWFDFFVCIVFSVFVVLSIRYQIKLLDYLAFGDEAETIVAAKMMASGQKLYLEIFNHHGPLTFLSGFLLETLGGAGIYGHRIPIAVLQVLALSSIYFSPLLGDVFTKKIYTVSAGAIGLLFFPELFGSMYMYQVIAGLLIIIVLTQYTLPAIVIPEKISSRNFILGNVLISCLPFISITYAPIALFMFFGSLRKVFLGRSVFYLAAGVLANVGFLSCVGSITGFFAFHIYLNSEILPQYNGGQSGINLVKNVFFSVTGNLTGFSFFVLLVAAISRLSRAENRFPWRSLFLGAGIASLLIRGLGFQGLPYYYSLLAMPLVLFIDRPIVSRQSQMIAMLFVVVCVVKLSLLIPGDNEKLESIRNPVSTDFSRLVQRVTDKGDRIIAYSFNNYEYIAADRLPASGHFFYLPWQEKYNENPKLGIKIDACKEIYDYRPKVMLIDKWNVGGNYSWESYAGCIQRLLDKEYVQYPGRPYYLRRDVAEAFVSDFNTAGANIVPSVPLSALAPIKIYMSEKNKEKNSELKGVWIRFGTYVRRNFGEAELRLNRLDGTDFVRRFSLSELVDNEYHHFDIDSNIYTDGEIVSLSGEGVSTWENHEVGRAIHTCIIYEYVDGNKMGTPGCPF